MRTSVAASIISFPVGTDRMKADTAVLNICLLMESGLTHNNNINLYFLPLYAKLRLWRHLEFVIFFFMHTHSRASGYS